MSLFKSRKVVTKFGEITSKMYPFLKRYQFGSSSRLQSPNLDLHQNSDKLYYFIYLFIHWRSDNGCLNSSICIYIYQDKINEIIRSSLKIIWQTINTGCKYVQLDVNIGVMIQQGKSEGFDSCDRSSNLTQIRFKSIFLPARPWNLMGDLEK